MPAEVPLRSGAQEYTLHFGVNSVTRLEAETGMRADEVITASAEGLNMTLLRALVWAGLKDRHPNVSLEDAGNIIDGVGLQVTATAVGKALASGFPEAQGKADPQKAVRAGTGKRS